MRLSAREAWKLEITPEVRADPVFSFAEKAERNDTIISNLPGMWLLAFSGDAGEAR